MKQQIADISKQTIQRYSDRFDKLGRNVRTLGWGTREQQFYRFEQTLSGNVDFQDKVLLDIGCGFGDYYNFLQAKVIPIEGYIGWDLNPDLINEANVINSGSGKAVFEVKNVFDLTGEENPVADIGVALGVLNFNLKNSFDNYEYSRLFIHKAFTCVHEALIVDFLSSKLNASYPEEDFVFYHNPSMMLEYALTLTDKVLLLHNYAPIPQKEFMLILFK